MTKRTALVFGKFYPFHFGHEKLIAFARQHCSQLIILVCASDKEKLSAMQRASWIQKTYASDSGIRVVPFSYSESDLPNTSVSSHSVSKVWAERFSQMLPEVSLIVTGEDYGDYVAEYMGIQHIRYSAPKSISATLIRGDIQKYWDSINSNARPDLLKKVAILGTESTGKTTLASMLAKHFDAELVTEAGRDIVPVSTECTKENLTQIATAHAEAIKVKSKTARRLLIMDTDITTTMSYNRFLFNTELQVPPEILAHNKADLYLFLDNDAPFVQDGTRLSEPARNELNSSHKQTLKDLGVSYTTLTGSFSNKHEKALALVRELVPSGL